MTYSVIKNKTHYLKVRIYYEDTDAGGVVYYANYLKFAERARTEFLRELDINQTDLAVESDILFVVRKADFDIIRPAKLDDLVNIETKITGLSGPKLEMYQEIKKDEQTLCTIKILIVSINSQFKPIRIPGEVNQKLLPYV